MRLYFLLLLLLPAAAFAQKEQTDSLTSAIDSLPSKEIQHDTTAVDKELKGKTFLKEYNQAYFLLKELNKGLGGVPEELNLQSPQACLEHFILSSREGDYKLAAYALNLNLLPGNVQIDKAAQLAQKLHYVIDKRIRINWDELPDRPDGQVDISTSTNSAVAGKARKSISFGSLPLDGRNVTFRVQRVKLEGKSPVWLISSNTVENIEELYKKFGPTSLDRMVPEWADFEILGQPAWKLAGLLLLALLSYLLGKLVSYIIQKTTRPFDSNWASGIRDYLAAPAGALAGFFSFYIGANNLFSVSGPYAPWFYSLVLVLLIASVTWLLMRTMNYMMDRFADTQSGELDDYENLEAKRYLTYISVARRVITFIIIIIGIGVILSQFDSLQNLGISLMASAGVATVILGIAAQSTLGNIIAGLQIAITKPCRIGDSVIFEGEYGTVEDIRFTYLIIKTWDDRRVVIPLQYFVTHPFENWSLNDPHLIKPIILHADYKVDVEKVRDKFSELLKAEEKYDEQKPPTLQVVGSSAESIEMRALCSAKDASTAWDLHCTLREKMISYIAELEGGKHLAKERVLVQQDE